MNVGEMIWKNWAETLAIALLVIGFLLSISISSTVLLYIVVILSGFLAGRFYFSKIGKKPLFPFFLIIVGFMLGYALGSFNANRTAIIILFIICWIASHILHKKGYIPL
ncbi:hypothetical protein KY332_02015 [Candidatus Woesearchaeota archaeon]|nr:hypothetical protein [Candidatus Woesearchaeota archaeon]